MLRIYFSSVIFILVFFLSSNQAFCEEYEHDAVYHELKKEYKLNEDGSIEFHYYKKLEIKTYYAFHRKYGETFIVYNPKYQDLTINKSVTTMADGTVVPAPDNAFNEVLPRQAKNAPAYNHLREMVVTHTGLQKGAVIELDYTITSKAGFYPLLMNREILSKEIPVKKMEVIASIPEDAVLNHQATGIRTAPEVKKNDGRKHYSWKFSNLDAHPSEPYSPKPYQFLPMLEFSTGNIAKEIAAINAKEAKSTEAFNTQMEDILRIIELPGESKKTERIYQLYKFVKENINHYTINPAYYGFKPRSANKVLQSNGAKELEACRLLAKMLQHTDIEAELVYAFSHSSTRPEKNLMFPAFPMVQVEYERESLFLNPFHSLDKNPLLHNKNLSVYFLEGKRAGRIIPVKKYNDNIFALTMDLNLDKKDNVTGTAKINLSGAFNQRLNFMLNQEKAVNSLANHLGLKFSDAEVNVESSRTTIHAKVDAGKLSQLNGLKSFSMDNFRLKTGEINLSRISDKRKNPLSLDFPFTEKLDITLNLPDEAQPIMDNKRESTHKTKNSLFQCKIKPRSNKILIERELTIDKERSSQNFNYQGMKTMMLYTRMQKHNQILFK